MKIISITVASDTREAATPDAARSVVNWIDEALMVHIDNQVADPDNTVEVFKRIVGAKFRMAHVAAGIPFEVMRNAGLVYCDEQAMREGELWSCQLDTDERIDINRVDIHRTLAKIPRHIQAVTIFNTTGTDDKYRFIRHPTPLRFSQEFHEELRDTQRNGAQPISCSITGVRFHELPKSPEQIMLRVQQQVGSASAQIEREPDNPRWHYYLASALEKLGRIDDAIKTYHDAIPLFKENEPKAWCSFRIACCHASRGQHGQALRAAVDGMIYRPDYPELPWLIASIQLAIGNWGDAASWARLAAVNNWSRKNASEIDRIGFKEPVALYEGPYQITAEAYRRAGRSAQAQAALSDATRAAKARKNYFERGV